jgi:type VI secretion system protein ImpJ
MLMEERTRIACIVGGLPHFEAVLSTGIAHPFALYLSLCSMAGQLASLGPGMLPPVFPSYDHKDILASFSEVARFATRMIEEGVPESYQAIPFKFKDGVFSLPFETAWANKRLVIGARISPKVSEKDLTSWMEECLIGSDSVIPSMRDRRILGAGRHYVERDEDLVPVRGVVLYAMDYDVEFIKTGQALQVFDVGARSKAFRPLELVLYVKERG